MFRGCRFELRINFGLILNQSLSSLFLVKKKKKQVQVPISKKKNCGDGRFIMEVTMLACRYIYLGLFDSEVEAARS